MQRSVVSYLVDTEAKAQLFRRTYQRVRIVEVRCRLGTAVVIARWLCSVAMMERGVDGGP